MIILLSILLSWVSPANAENSCLELFAFQNGQLRSDFKHSTKMDVVLPDSSPIKNQCGLALCHLYSWSYEIQNRSGIEISTDYLDAMYLYDRAHWGLNNGRQHFEESFGADAITSRDAIRVAGLVPEGAWTSNTNFKDPATVRRIIQTVETIIINTNALRSRQNDSNERARVLEEGRKELDAFLDSVIGRPPASFVYEGKTYDPQSFAERFFPEMSLPVTTASVATNLKLATIYNRGSYKEADISVDQAEALAKNLIDSGRPAIFAYEHNRSFVDLNTGIMSIGAFYFGELAQPLNRQAKDIYGQWKNSHSIMAIGYELDPVTGYVKKWLLKNSWGPDKGDQGYMYMYRDFFISEITAVSYVDDGSIQPINRVIKAYGP